MKLIIVPSDKFVSVDGVGYHGIDTSSLDANIHAVQWYGSDGEIERVDSVTGTRSNESITSVKPFDDIVALWTAADDAAKNPPLPTGDALARMLNTSVQFHMDGVVRVRGYDGILALCTYATSTNPVFAGEGQAGVAWRDAVWDVAIPIIADVVSGKRPIPTPEDWNTLLPPMVWPS